MTIRIHLHAQERMRERGATEEEVLETVKKGERFPAKFGRTGFRHNFPFGKTWRGKVYRTKQIEAFCAREEDEWVVITVLVKYF